MPEKTQARAAISTGGAKDILPDWSPCQTAAECVRSRCHILCNGEGEMKAFLCRAHALLILFDDAVQA